MRAGGRNRKTHGLPKGFGLVEVCKLLNEQGADYLVVGAQACALHGLIRATKDIDLLIPRDVLNTERLLEALKNLTWGIAGELDAEEVTKKPITIIGDMPRVDLLTVANKVRFAEARRKALAARIDGVRIPYVDFKTLVKTKETGRLQDQADIERLRQMVRKKGVG